MCIFNGPVAEVSKTQIAVVPVVNGKQLVIYSNKVSLGPNAGPNAMVLPVPLRPGSQPELVNLAAYAGIFDDLANAFPMDRGADEENLFLNSDSLRVVQVGSYKVSVALTLDDLRRIDASVFTVAPNIDQLLSANYGQGFGFVICVFDATMEAHPLAFVCDRNADGSLYVPTRHEHGHGDEAEAEFDHTIYTINTDENTGGMEGELETAIKYVQWQKVFGDKSLDAIDGGLTHIRRRVISGLFANADISATLEARAVGACEVLLRQASLLIAHTASPAAAAAIAEATAAARAAPQSAPKATSKHHHHPIDSSSPKPDDSYCVAM